MIEPYPDLFAEFAETARRTVKRFLTVTEVGGNESVTLGDSAPLRFEAAPVFDMSFLRDLSTGRALDLDLYNALSKQGEEMLHAGSFRLPFPECWFVIWFSDGGGSRYETVNLLHAVETESGGVHVVTYFRCMGAPGEMGKWTQAPIQTVWEPAFDGGWIALTETHFASERWYAERKADAEVMLNNVLVSTLLLAGHPEPPEGKTTDYLASVNRGRERAKLAPLPAVRLIDLTKYNYPADGSGMGGSVRPHDRRGHYRTLKTGRVVPVRASKIHGGSDAPCRATAKLAGRPPELSRYSAAPIQSALVAWYRAVGIRPAASTPALSANPLLNSWVNSLAARITQPGLCDERIPAQFHNMRRRTMTIAYAALHRTLRFRNEDTNLFLSRRLMMAGCSSAAVSHLYTTDRRDPCQ